MIPTMPGTEANTNPTMPNNLPQNKGIHGNYHRGNESGAVGMEIKKFIGETPDLDSILTLATEKVEKGVTFDKFQDRLKNHILKTFKNAEDIVCLITDLKDPADSFEAKHAPMEPTPEEEQSVFKMKIWEMKIKHYIDHEKQLRENIHKHYRLIIGKFTPAVRSTIKREENYNEKSVGFDALWLLEKIKAITAGVDMKANPSLTLGEKIMTFSTQVKA